MYHWLFSLFTFGAYIHIYNFTTESMSSCEAQSVKDMIMQGLFSGEILRDTLYFLPKFSLKTVLWKNKSLAKKKKQQNNSIMIST